MVTVQELESFMKRGEVSVPYYIPTGSTLLNLCCSDKVDGGYIPGRIVNLVGDSDTGKSILSLTMLAEMAHNEFFDNYKLIYDDVEAALSFNIERLFGQKTVDRLCWPAEHTEDPEEPTETVEQFLYNLLDWTDAGEPFVYILDSFDPLTSLQEIGEVADERDAVRKGKQVSGTFGASRAKGASRLFRQVKSAVAETKALVIIVSQTRDNLGFGFKKSTRAGGRALKFYATNEIWLNHKGSLTSKNVNIGTHVACKVEKNRGTGKKRECEFKIYYDYGVDDIGGMVDFLVDNKRWEKEKNSVVATDFDIKASHAKLIETIEETGLVEELKEVVQETWDAIEESVSLNRKGRFEEDDAS